MKNTQSLFLMTSIRNMTLALVGLALLFPNAIQAQAQAVDGYWETEDGGLLVLEGTIELGVYGVIYDPGNFIAFATGSGSDGSATLVGLLEGVEIDINVDGDTMTGSFNVAGESSPFTAVRTGGPVASPLNGFWLLTYEDGTQTLAISITTRSGETTSTSIVELNWGPVNVGFRDFYLAVVDDNSSQFAAFGLFGFNLMLVDYFDSEFMSGQAGNIFGVQSFTGQKLF